jgi:hypothetical protein
MSFKIGQLKHLSPALINLLCLVLLQICIFSLGWYNQWWTQKNSTNQSQVINSYSEYNQQFKNLETTISANEKNSKLQKLAYQIIMGPLSQYQELNNQKEWKNLINFWNENKFSEVVENNLDERVIGLKGLVASFNGFVTEKNYPTLVRVSSRMKVRELTNDVKSLEASLFAYVKDIEFMQATIRTSNLDEVRKIELNNLLSEIQSSVVNLQKDVESGIQGQTAFKTLSFRIKEVLAAMKPLIAEKTIESTMSFNGNFYWMVSLFLLSIALGIWLLLNEKNNKSQLQSQWENNFLMLSNDAFIKGINPNMSNFSSNFNSTFHQIYNFILKKMQYGQMFQETIPFPTILIDSNLQVRWFNQSLISEWHLENFIRDRESLSWEHFSQLTNMSANDPVIDVIKNQHAGIFKLQVKPIEGEKAVPYQMYVTPYQIGDEKLCLLFFYPLLSLEETIEMQTQSVVGPVRNTLMALLDNKYNEEYSENSKSDYEVGSIEELHFLFNEYYDKNFAEQKELLNQLNDKDIKLQDQYQIVQSLDSNIEQLRRLQIEMKQSIQELKQFIIQSFENVDSVKMNSYELINSFRSHWDKFNILQQHAEKLITIFNCSKEQVQQVSQLKSTTKEVRDAIQAHRSNSIKVIKAMSAFVDKQSQNRNPLYNTWNSTMSELSKLPDFLSSLDRYIQHSEMILGKIVMKLEDSYKNVDESFSLSLQANHPTNINEMVTKFDEIESLKDGLISSLKDVYGLMQEQMKISAKSHENLYYNNLSLELDQDIQRPQ